MAELSDGQMKLPDDDRVIEQMLDQGPPELKAFVRKQNARIRQLRMEIKSRREENTRIIDENLQQHEVLHELNAELDKKVKERTAALEQSKRELEERNDDLQELNESKEAMMHMIVHDMKNPLTSVMGALALMQRLKCDGISDDMQGLIKDAHIQSIKLRTMMDDILTISKMKSREFKADLMEVDLVSLVQQSVLLMNTVKGDKELTIGFNPPCTELVVMMDFQMIERVLNNIINNAIKYAPPKSEITLGISIEGREAVVSVTDLGKGIPAGYHQKVFEMFTRVNPNDKKINGTGLGLAYCKLAMDAHDARIWIESPAKGYDCGTTFKFSLPIAETN